ncbi:hypothetical protein COO60DRAFT_272504 [Scenedesmus sp. NREL 46B-D3]|nr:hypothetical protein COO60DRAFT_272504 [Scenedesmus sp. NREL 46B-D3]
MYGSFAVLVRQLVVQAGGRAQQQQLAAYQQQPLWTCQVLEFAVRGHWEHAAAWLVGSSSSRHAAAPSHITLAAAVAELCLAIAQGGRGPPVPEHTAHVLSLAASCSKLSEAAAAAASMDSSSSSGSKMDVSLLVSGAAAVAAGVHLQPQGQAQQWISLAQQRQQPATAQALQRRALLLLALTQGVTAAAATTRAAAAAAAAPLLPAHSCSSWA